MKRRAFLRASATAAAVGAAGATASADTAAGASSGESTDRIVSSGESTDRIVPSGEYTDEYHDGVHYTRYVPDGGGADRPLVVMLHGCSQEPDEFAYATGMNALAAAEGFSVVYPDQSSFSNSFDCWNWYYDYNTARGSGEGADITSIALHEVDRLGADASRVYVAGFSAGAAMVPNLLVAYPDVYAAGAVHSGLEYDAAETATGATWSMTYGGPDPEAQALDAYEAMVGNDVVGRTPTAVFHGTDDYTVDPVNGYQAAVQAAGTSDYVGDGAADGDVSWSPSETATGSTGGFDWQRERHVDAQGRVAVERWTVDGLGHDWSGGASGATYAEPDAPSATDAIWRFFERW
ncbi:PHB depolymerase family esterase [Halorubellus litoreus]|uniref:Alpha/beta hydrolase family esterase n=1 Tax=Halorubellus litoreus TaxID=755308 RepID=A0ABD5VF30_9EURY